MCVGCNCAHQDFHLTGRLLLRANSEITVANHLYLYILVTVWGSSTNHDFDKLLNSAKSSSSSANLKLPATEVLQFLSGKFTTLLCRETVTWVFRRYGPSPRHPHFYCLHEQVSLCSRTASSARSSAKCPRWKEARQVGLQRVP